MRPVFTRMIQSLDGGINILVLASRLIATVFILFVLIISAAALAAPALLQSIQKLAAPYGADFPPLRARDWVESQRLLMEHLDIDCWAAVVGGSLGGMQAMRWSLEYPGKLKHAVVIASSA